MKIAIISDSHGNLPALEAVLSEIDQAGIDEIINVGDTLGGPLESARTANLLMQRRSPMAATPTSPAWSVCPAQQAATSSPSSIPAA